MPLLEKRSSDDFAIARYNMVESQIRPNKVTDKRLLDVMARVPRELFLPPLLAGIAYKDEDIQVAPGRYLMEPMVLARLLQEASIRPEDRVLDIAPATGYSSAVLAGLAKEVIPVESDPALVTKAVGNFAFLEITNVDMQLAPLVGGWEHKGPYNVIFLNGSVEMVPDTLLAQLAEGGRLMAVVRQYGVVHAMHKGEARLYEKINGHISHRALFDANIKPLPGFRLPATFTFA